MTESLAEAYLIALDTMKRVGPKDFHKKASQAAEDLASTPAVSDAALRDYLLGAHPDDELRRKLNFQLASWDAARAADAAWTEETEPGTPQRREVINRSLKIDDTTGELLEQLFPIANRDETIVIADRWDPWYTPEVQQRRDFYWDHYSTYLMDQRGWSAEAVTKLDAATTHVVERLHEPTRTNPGQAKGLVVGYVQSGKTANFTGVIAKAIDAGYRLIIVMTGTTNLLRDQTQRRLDMELVGRENILRGVDVNDPEALARVDYQQDEDWINNRFLSHGFQPAERDFPDIYRMTTRTSDYRSLHQGIAALDFERANRNEPLSDPSNLFNSNARLVVVKKNKQALEKFVKDLGAITAKLGQIPALIIDDESDQASINTSNPKRWEQGKPERTAINALISKLLLMLPRGQYVGYTATPFANVFVDPSDAEDIFPGDFVIALERPPGYMGADDFHDLDSSIPLEERTFANSKEKAHLRLLQDDEDGADLLKAMDMFVLAGAMKLFRQQQGMPEYRHHTMLVHEAMKTEVHRAKALVIKDTWNKAGYFSSTCRPRLRYLFETDILPVSRSLAAELPNPGTFEELLPHITATARKINSNNNPVLIVNSDKDIAREELNFDQHPVWRILVGGNKLARGFTVEGLTVSYYRRGVQNADALMQMGRWFGFRKGYRDLVRLHVTADLRDAFESICRDEEDFREELRQYTGFDEAGQPLVTPAQIPPLVSSRMLRPTAASKMYNAVLEERRTLTKEPSSGYPALSNKTALERNLEAFVPAMAAAIHNEKRYQYGRTGFQAYVATMSNNELLAILGQLQWAHEDTFRPDLNWLKKLTPDLVRQWKVVFPQQSGGLKARFQGHGPFSLHRRSADSDRVRGNATSLHRHAIDDAVKGSPRTGSMLVYPVVSLKTEKVPEDDPADVIMAIRLALPEGARPINTGPLRYTARDSSKPWNTIIS